MSASGVPPAAAANLTEQVAAKTALQEASAAIAERLLPKIAGFKPAERPP